MRLLITFSIMLLGIMSINHLGAAKSIYDFTVKNIDGEDIHPLYLFLTSKETNPEYGGEIIWNFNKFLIDKSGKIIGRFESKDKPESDKLVDAIQKVLK